MSDVTAYKIHVQNLACLLSILVQLVYCLYANFTDCVAVAMDFHSMGLTLIAAASGTIGGIFINAIIHSDALSSFF